MEKLNSFILLDILGIILYILILIFCLKGVSVQKKIDVHTIDTLRRNWLNSPLMDISSSPSECEEFPIIAESLEIMNERCNCSKINNNSTINRACTTNEINNGCLNEKKLQYKDINKVGGNYLCGLGTSNWKGYFSINTTGYQEQCTNNTRSCGYIDTLNNKLCVGVNETCPINKIVIIEKNKEEPQDFNYKRVDLTNTNYIILYTNENINGSIITHLKISETFPYLSESPTYLQFPPNDNITNAIYVNNSIYFDERYSLISHLPYVDLLIQNQKDKLLLPYDIFDHNVGVYQTNYVGVSSVCKSKYPQRFFNSIPRKLNEMIDIIVFENKFPTLITLSIILIILHCAKLILKLFQKETFAIYLTEYYLNCLILFFQVGFISISMLLIISLNNHENYFDFIMRPACSDQISSFYINNFNRKIKDSSMYISTNAFLSLLSFIVPVIDLLRRKINKSKYDVEDHKQQKKLEEIIF